MSEAADWNASISEQCRANLRLLKWLRREVNRDLANWRRLLADYQPFEFMAQVASEAITDCQAKRAMIRWAESWQDRQNATGSKHAEEQLAEYRQYIMYGIRFVALAYAGRPGYRPEWKPPGR